MMGARVGQGGRDTLTTGVLADDGSQEGVYSRGYNAPPSAESLNRGGPQPAGPFQGGYDRSGTASPTFTDYESSAQHGGPYSRLREPYPAWSNEQQIPLSKEEIEDVFIDLANKFGFQRDSVRSFLFPLSRVLEELTKSRPRSCRCATCTTTS